MKFHKSTILIALLGLLLVAFVAVMAQQAPAQSDQKKQSEACCAMDSCCCKGDSCPLKKEGTTNAEAKDECCCCSGDSCDMEKHAQHSKKDHSADGSCCNMKHKDMKRKETKKQDKTN